MASSVDIELQLLKEKFEKDSAEAAEDLKSKLGGASAKAEQADKDRAKASDQANRQDEKGARFAQAAQRAREQNSRSRERSDREQEKRAERLLRVQQRIKEIEEAPNRAGLGIGAALLAGGATLSQSALGAQTAHFLSSIGSRFAAGRQLRDSKQNLLEAQKSGDPEKLEEATEEYGAAKGAVSMTTKNLVAAGVAALVTAIVKGGKEAFTNESLERGLFQRTGRRADQILPAREMARIRALGLNQQEAVSLATDVGGATSTTEFGAGSAFEQLAKLRFSHGEQAASSATGMLGEMTKRGVLGDATGVERDRKLAELISRGTGVAVATNLERGRTGEAFEAMRILAASLQTGQDFNAEQAATALRMVGQDPSLRGTQGAGAVQTMEALGQGKLGGMSKMISMMTAMREGGPDQSPLDLAANMEKIGRDPVALARTLKQLAPDKEQMDMLFATFTPLFGGGVNGELAKKLSKTMQRGGVPEPTKGLDLEVPASLKGMKAASDTYADSAAQLGETFRDSGGPAAAQAAANKVFDMSVAAQNVTVNASNTMQKSISEGIDRMGPDASLTTKAVGGMTGVVAQMLGVSKFGEWLNGKLGVGHHGQPDVGSPISRPTSAPSVAAAQATSARTVVPDMKVDVTLRDPHGVVHQKAVESAVVYPVGRSGLGTPLPTR